MAQAQLFVLSRHPGAMACFNNDTLTWKVYASRDTWVSLSASFSVQSDAWKDAESAIKERESATPSQERTSDNLKNDG